METTQQAPARTQQNGGLTRPQEDSRLATQFIPFGAKDAIKLSVKIVQEMICVPSRSGKVCNETEAIKFMMFCKAKALNPFEGDCFLLGYDSEDGKTASFSLITAHQAYLKRAEVHPEFDGMDSGLIVKQKDGAVVDREGDFLLDDDFILGGWAIVHFKTRKHPMKKRVALKTFNTGKSRWKKDPAGMIVKCFDEATEILTSNGFEKFADATGRILQVTEYGLEVTDALPFVQQYTGSMVTLESDDLNFSVTPNHDILTTAGKIEAGVMLDKARSRPNLWIPRCVNAKRTDFGMSDAAIELAAIYLADGSDRPYRSFWVSVSRPRKIQKIESLGLHHSRHVAIAAGTLAVTETRQIETKSDKQAFGFDFNQIAPLVSRGKEISIASLLALSRRQARLFIDTLIEFDGTTVKATGVRRFFSSRPALMAAFEIGAVAAGYSVSYRRERVSDLSDRTNFSVSISGRSEIGVRRWGRPYHNLEVEKGRRPASLELTRNESGKVWCVTVPSGLIVVRRRGFSMVCGNCAESDALRSSFPTMLGPLGVPDQMTPLSQFDPAASQMPCLDTRKQTQAPEQIETADQSPRPSEGDASEIPDDEASQRMAMEIQDAIDGAANGEEHAAVRVKLDAAQDTLGDATYIALVRMWRAKGKEIGVK